MTIAPPLRQRFASRDVSLATVRSIMVPVLVGGTAVAFIIPLLISPEAMPRPEPLTITTLMGLLAVSLVVGFFTAAWVWLEAALGRARGHTDLVIFVGVYAIGGALVGVVMVICLPMVGFNGRAPAIVPVLSLAFMAAWTAFALGTVREASHRVCNTRREMVEQAAAVVLTSANQSELIVDLRNQLNADLEGSLRPTFERTVTRLDSLADLAEDRATMSAAQMLTDLTELSVRPFSRILNHRAQDPGHRRGPIAFIRGVARRQPFRLVPVILIFVVTSLAEAWTGVDPVPALTATTVGVACIVGILGLGNILMSRWPRWHTSIFVASFFILQVPTVAWIAINESITTPRAIGEIAVTVLVSACIVWLSSGVGHWRAPEEELLAIFAEELDSARIEVLTQGEILRTITKDVARNLHGSVQSRLTACVLALDRAAQAKDLDAHAHAVARAREILSQAWFVPIPEAPNTDIDAMVRDKVAMWQGLAGITAYVDHGVHDLRGLIVARVGEIVEEGVCNAVRHGEADTVSVQVEHIVEVGVRYVRIRVMDDGRGPGDWAAGLGMAFVDEACGGRWSLQAGPAGGGLLDAWVPAGPE
jgi:signal transduction histidine kinase